MSNKIVYFLGAGCSKKFGYPLTGDIMPEILEKLKAKNLFQLGEQKQVVEKSRNMHCCNLSLNYIPG